MVVFDYIRHLLYGVFLGWMISVLLNFTISEKIIYFPCVAIGSLLPDIDMPESKAGKRIKLVSKFINKKVGHRTLTHSLFFITVLYYSSNIAFGVNIFSTGLMVGCVMHVLCDLFTPSGVPLAYPISNKRYRLE